MRIAIPYDNGQIFKRFGHAAQFKFYDVDGGRIIREQIIDLPPKKGHAVLSDFLKNTSPDLLICDRIGDGGQRELKKAGIELYAGINSDADEAVKAYIEGSLPKKDITNTNKKHGAHLDVPISFY